MTETKIEVNKSKNTAETVKPEESKADVNKEKKTEDEKASTGKFGEREGSEIQEDGLSKTDKGAKEGNLVEGEAETEKPPQESDSEH